MKSIFSKGILNLNYKQIIESLTSEEHLKEIYAREARLIPCGKKDDELSIASVFLSSLKYVKEYREMLTKLLNISKIYKLACFNEVSFPLFYQENEKKKRARFDGMLLSLSASGVIKDAVLFEMKYGNEAIDEEQMTLYLEMAKELGFNKFVTISNEYVAVITESPKPSLKKMAEKGKKKIELLHLSWDQIRLLMNKIVKNKKVIIADEDQLNIMNEVLVYFTDCGAIKTFDRMSDCWKPMMKELSSSNVVISAENKKYISRIINDWYQQERDLAFKFGDRLSTYEIINVQTNKTGKMDLDEKIKQDEELLINSQILQSVFKVPNCISPITVTFDIKRKLIRQEIIIPFVEGEGITSKKQLGFIREDLRTALRKNQELFMSFASDSFVLINTKGKNANLKYSLIDFLNPENVVFDKGILFKNAIVFYEKEIGNDLYNPVKSIALEEKLVFMFYDAVVQYLTKRNNPAPRLEKQVEINDCVEE